MCGITVLQPQARLNQRLARYGGAWGSFRALLTRSPPYAAAWSSPLQCALTPVGAAVAAGLDWGDDPWRALTGALKELAGRKGKALFQPLRLARSSQAPAMLLAAAKPRAGFWGNCA